MTTKVNSVSTTIVVPTMAWNNANLAAHLRGQSRSRYFADIVAAYLIAYHEQRKKSGEIPPIPVVAAAGRSEMMNASIRINAGIDRQVEAVARANEVTKSDVYVAALLEAVADDDANTLLDQLWEEGMAEDAHSLDEIVDDDTPTNPITSPL